MIIKFVFLYKDKYYIIIFTFKRIWLGIYSEIRF